MGTHGEIGMAMAMMLPYLRYLQVHVTDLKLLPKQLHRFLPPAIHKPIRLGFGLATFLTGLAILGTQSRGAMLAGGMVVAFLVMKSRQKSRIILLLLLAIPVMLTFMPEKWWDRMDTISTDESQLDSSSTGRISAWWMAYNLANAELTGGGYNCFQWPEFEKYSPTPGSVHDAHSIYFEVLGEHGWVGLILFMALAMTTWFKASKVARRAKKHKRLWWLSDLARMSQVSLAAYATSGLFIGQSYFDLYYAVIAIIVISDYILTEELKKLNEEEGKGKTPSPVVTPNRSWQAYGGPRRQPPRRPS
jgi:probable O-glycosylation ligase (exosortase A-associated)